jgi:hypothetical protein
MAVSWALLDRLRRPTPVSTLRPLEQEPSVVQFTPSSILLDPAGRQSWFCNGRARYATCSGVSWFHDDHLACVNVLGNAIHVYRFDRGERSLSPVQTIRDAPMLRKPENISCAPDGSLVAITDMGDADLKVFRIDPRTHEIELDGHAVAKHPADRTAHGVAFSRCGRFVAHTTVDRPGVIRVHRIVEKGGALGVEPFQVVENEHYPLVPKGIDFARDGSRVAICHGPNVSREKRHARVGRLEIRAFDGRRGIGSKPLSVAGPREGVGPADDVRFFADDAYVVLTHQGDDNAVVLPIDPATSRVARAVQTLANPSARLSFPHGAGASPDGRWVAITSYGDDKLGIYAVASPAADSRGAG